MLSWPLIGQHWSRDLNTGLSLAGSEVAMGGNNGERDLGQSHTLPSSVQPIRGEDCEALTNQKREEE